MQKRIEILSLATLFLSGCAIDLNPIPANADPAEADAVATLKPLARNIGWNEDGKVFSIDLGDNIVTSDVIISVNQLDSLLFLGFPASNLTDNHLSQLEGNKIIGLSLAWTAVTDEGLAHLEAFTNLRSLDLGRTNISDNAIPQLSRLHRLKHLFIEGTQLTGDGEEELRQSLPDTLVQTSD